jgi:hypothetical protein
MTNLFEISKKLSTSALTEVINLNQNNKEIEILQKINIEKIKSFNLKRTFIKKNLKKVVIFFNATNYGEVTTKYLEKVHSCIQKKQMCCLISGVFRGMSMVPLCLILTICAEFSTILQNSLDTTYETPHMLF